MREFMMTTGVVFGLFTVQAFASDPAPAEDAATEEVDCSTLEGDAKTECEAKQAEEQAPDTTDEPEPEPAKGGKAKRSNTNRLEGEVTDE